jgi:hypothetical protein
MQKTCRWVVALLLSVGGAAKADDQPFLTVYTTDIDTQYEKEVEQSLYWSTQKPHQAFNGWLSRTEFEYGVTDDFQVSGYLNYDWDRSHLHPPTDRDNTFQAASLSAEAIYRLMNPYFDPLGLAVYFEPTYGGNVRELEAKLLLQKNLFDDTLRLAGNLNVEDKWEREAGHLNRGSAVEFFAGAAYNITPEWSMGLEFNNENDFEGLFGAAHPETAAYYLGPTISHVGLPFTIQLGAQFQMPWASDRSHTPGAVQNGFLTEAERSRVGIRLKMDLP